VTEPAQYPVWTVHVADLKSPHAPQPCARCHEAIVADPAVAWPYGRLVAVRTLGRRLEVRLIDDPRDDLLDDELPCGEQ